MAYAELAGLPAVTGLYTTIACLVGYALFGPSRVLVLGPDSSISPLILASITPLLVVGDPGSAIALAGMLAIFVGLIEIGLGLGKLGFVADLLSKEVQVGYMNGLGITIIVGQLPKLFGLRRACELAGSGARVARRPRGCSVGAFFKSIEPGLVDLSSSCLCQHLMPTDHGKSDPGHPAISAAEWRRFLRRVVCPVLESDRDRREMFGDLARVTASVCSGSAPHRSGWEADARI
jgi:Sulfate permease family